MVSDSDLATLAALAEPDTPSLFRQDPTQIQEA
jgi:hypothetical protein